MEYILNHLQEMLTAEQTAEEFGYNVRYFMQAFRNYFEMPFHKYVTKLRLRWAADMLRWKDSLQNQWSDFGYKNNSSFCNAFKKEFGLGPNQFRKQGREIPYMPGRKYLFGIPVEVCREEVADKTVRAHYFQAELSGKLNLMEEVAYALRHPNSETDMESEETHYGFWHFLEEVSGGLCYLYGTKITGEKTEETVDQKQKTAVVHMAGTHYVRFSIPRQADDRDTAQALLALARYIFREWKIVNMVHINGNSWVFEEYKRERVSVFVPIQEELLKESRLGKNETGIESWTGYIDQRICEKLNTANLADHFYYSEKNFKTLFHLYYNISPAQYILKRRLYLAAKELGMKRDLEAILQKYHFSSPKRFEELFQNEFHRKPEEYREMDEDTVNLVSYYWKHKRRIHLVFHREEPFWILGRAVRSQRSREDITNVPEQAAMYFTNPPYPSNHPGMLPERGQAALWDETVSSKSGEILYDYALGPEAEPWAEAPEDWKKFRLEGGWYAVFQTGNPSDVPELAENFRLLTRCAFYGWIQENMYRYDGKRITYVRYREEKLEFYVPLNM